MKYKYKKVTVTVELLLKDDQPVIDWLPSAIQEIIDISEGEELLSYDDNEPVVVPKGKENE